MPFGLTNIVRHDVSAITSTEKERDQSYENRLTPIPKMHKFVTRSTRRVIIMVV